LLARNYELLQQAKTQFVGDGYDPADITIESMDMADAEAIMNRVPKFEALQDGLFGLVNNAACEQIKRVTEYTLEDMEKTWQVNMRGPLLMIQACYPFLKKAGGSIVNVGSIADTGYAERYSLYGGSKAFLNSFSQHAGKEFGFEGVRINIVSPGPIDTPLMTKILKLFGPDELKELEASIPIEQRLGRPEEVAAAIWFALAGPKYLHAADIRVTGGCGS
jgi:NAD(P)-dependent dehydrogenase (short-subunit alcohol dehydrogenase family)